MHDKLYVMVAYDLTLGEVEVEKENSLGFGRGPG